MKIYKEFEVPSHKDVRHVKNTCDICGTESTGCAYDEVSDWKRDIYDVNETCIYHKIGESYPEGGNSEIESYHICPTCFQEKLKPFMESLGAKVNIEDTNY